MKVQCPTCRKDVEWSEASPHRPFCSKKCQLIDLGEWATEDRAIPGSKNIDEPGKMPDIEDIEEMLSKQSDDFFRH